ncbi:hypothetical protein Tcan_14257 [Toxocara canis]|uniref:Uncharacterized protein n=1 Tax=Toxocara canis TaxID=6265 RepID=A0A0B2VQR3_TOXCA|nr:hypothetical protein Tcan_14257 [Toxocara canis]
MKQFEAGCNLMSLSCGFQDQARYIQDGINLMNSLRSRTNLWQCQYQLPPSNTTKMRIKRKARKVRHIPKSCAGLYGAPMPYELVSSEHNVTAPRIRNELLKSLSGELVLASELMLRCPRCRENCHATTGPDAVAVAFQQALTPHNCADIMYEVRCHNTFEEMRIKRKARKVRHIPKSCAGLYGAPMPYELVSSEHNVTAPRIRNELLKSLSGELVLASELMLRCPRCRVTTHYYSDDNDNNNTDQICRRQLETIRPGWPTSAEYCDEEELLVVDLEKQIYC